MIYIYGSNNRKEFIIQDQYNLHKSTSFLSQLSYTL